MDATTPEAHRLLDHPTGWRRYLFSTNHKDIGKPYRMVALPSPPPFHQFNVLPLIR